MTPHRATTICDVLIHLLTDIRNDWPRFTTTLENLAEPARAGQGSRPTNTPDPTLNAVLTAEPWTRIAHQTNADLMRVVHLLRAIRTTMTGIVTPTTTDTTHIRCSGTHDPLCTDLASVGPTGRPDRNGLCIRCYTNRRRQDPHQQH